jgi:starch synthase
VSAIKVLFVTTEVAGLAKAGGLGEVSAGLPPALRQRGIDVRILMPAYRAVLGRLPSIDWGSDLPGRAAIPAGRLGTALLSDGCVLHLVAQPALFERPGTPYCTPEGQDWADNHLRFARLSAGSGRYRGGAGGPGLGAGHRARERLAGWADAGLYALGRHRGADRPDHS